MHLDFVGEDLVFEDQEGVLFLGNVVETLVAERQDFLVAEVLERVENQFSGLEVVAFVEGLRRDYEAFFLLQHLLGKSVLFDDFLILDQDEAEILVLVQMCLNHFPLEVRLQFPKFLLLQVVYQDMMMHLDLLYKDQGLVTN